MAEPDTPMMRQYRGIKQKHGDSILFFRLGDFYEMFEKDARDASAILNLTLTKRNGIPMCGIPYHASTGYIARLLKAGRKVAICEQVSLPQDGKGIAERRVTEIITPGTALEESFLEQGSYNYLVSIGRVSRWISLAYIDLSTGDFSCTAFPETDRGGRLRKELMRLSPREIIIQESLIEEDDLISRIVADRQDLVVNRYPDWYYDIENSAERLIRQFGVTNLKGFGLEDDDPALFSCGVLLEYVEDAAKSYLPHIKGIRHYSDEDYLALDESTQRNLEIVRNLQDGGRKYSLLATLDFTKTAMGSRKLRSWLLQPLNDIGKIRARIDSVEELYRNQLLLSSISGILGRILDLERLTARVAVDKAHAKDLLSVRDSLLGIIQTADLVTPWYDVMGGNPERRGIVEDIAGFIGKAIDDEPSILLTEGRLIRDGFDERLDDLRSLKDRSQEILDDYLAGERRESGIGNLKIRYNKIIGYFLEVTKSNLSQVPGHFIRRQSLVGSERYTTDRLIELETELNSASERIVELERELFLGVRERVKSHVPVLQAVAGSVAELDCLVSFARAATVRGYTKPILDDSTSVRIKAGRHPVVEANLKPGEFVPNDLTIDSGGTSFALITGPNMAGKSTYLRQSALIVLMAQAGSFVPAQEARIGIVDKIFCRVGASDNLARGESTFLVEMNETAYILRSVTRRSLVIMDEVGRGTSTNDGLAIAWAVTERLIAEQAKTLFATHFHELTAIEHPKLETLSMDVTDRNGEIVFLKRVKKGAAGNSYGIHVAKLAGIPEEVISRAQDILSSLELREDTLSERDRASRDAGNQADLFSPLELVGKEIESAVVERMTPLDALNLIARWHGELKRKGNR